MTLRCLSGDGSGDGGDDDGLAELGGEGDMSDTDPMTSAESGDEFGSLPDESGDMMGEEDQVRRGGKLPLKRAMPLEFPTDKMISCGGTVSRGVSVLLRRDCFSP